MTETVTEGKSKQAGYNSAYYERNKGDIQAQRRQRYQEDPEYREKVQRAARERKRRVLAEKKSQGLSGRKRGPKKPSKFTIISSGIEVEVLMFTSGQLGKKLGRKAQTIRLWERNGVIPPALYRKDCGDRLYTEFQVEKLLDAFAEAKKEKEKGKYVLSRISQTIFPGLAAEIWEDYPLGIDPSE